MSENTKAGEQPEVPELPIVDPDVITDDELFAEAERDVAAMQEKPKVDQAEANNAALLSIAKSMELMMKRQEEVRQIPFNEVKPVTPWNPEGKRDRLSFSRPTYQHGIPLNPQTHTEKTIALFNQLKPGRYIERKVEVQRSSDGSINLTYPGLRIDSRMQFYAEFPHIDNLLEAIITERKAKEERRKAGIVDGEEIL